MKFTKTILTAIIATSVLSANAYAASLDFRHEYKAKSKQHASRIKMGNTFDNNLSVDVEVKFKGSEGKFMDDLQQNGSEIGINYKHAFNSEWALIPGMPIEFGTERKDEDGESLGGNATYKPQLRLTYTPDSVEGLSISGRYRLDIKPGQDERKYRNRYTFNAGYKIDKLRLGLEMNYYKAHDSDYILYDNKDSNYENNVTAHYQMGNWTPWAEFGDVSVSSTSDTRELRSRVGIRYSF